MELLALVVIMEGMNKLSFIMSINVFASLVELPLASLLPLELKEGH
jgi:hypothetical protein